MMHYHSLPGDYSEKTGALFIKPDEIPLGDIVTLMKKVSPARAEEAEKKFAAAIKAVEKEQEEKEDQNAELKGKLMKKTEKSFAKAKTYHMQTQLQKEILASSARRRKEVHGKVKLSEDPNALVQFCLQQVNFI